MVTPQPENLKDQLRYRLSPKHTRSLMTEPSTTAFHETKLERRSSLGTLPFSRGICFLNISSTITSPASLDNSILMDLKRLFHISGNSLTNSFEEARNMFYPIFSDEKSFEITVDSYQFRCYCDSSGVVSVPTGFNSDNKADRIIINFGRGACDFFRLVAV